MSATIPAMACSTPQLSDAQMNVDSATNVTSPKTPKDISHYLSRTSRNRKPSQIKAFYKYFLIPGIGNLAGGLPYDGYFPYDTLEANVALPDRFKPTPNDPVDPPATSFQSLRLSHGPKASRVVVPHNSTETNVLRKIDLASALQYGTAQGYPPLYYFIRNFTREHLQPNVPYKDGAEIILTCGSTDGFAKTLEAFSNPWDESRDWLREREGLLCEEFAYMNAIQAARPRGLNIVPVTIDDEGMLASGKGGLRDVLENWDFKKGKRPHLMYTVTMGQNPTSGLLSLNRRKELYAVCHKYDVLIIEDDPYWYLQYPSANTLSMKARGHPVSSNFPTNLDHNYHTISGGRSSGYPFLDSLVPSYLNIDTDGRVIRLDTFSKTVAPGCRLGWITAQPMVCDYILRVTETSTQQPSGFVQSLIAELIMGPHAGDIDTTRKGGSQPQQAKGWKADGWVRWLEGLRGNYERRMQVMSQVLEDGKYLISHEQPAPRTTSTTPSPDADDYQLISKTQLYDFTYPLAGMFLWLHVHFPSHPVFHSISHERLARALWIFFTTEPYLTLLAPGSMFSPTDELREEKGWQYFRLCFAAVPEDKIRGYSERVVKGVRDFWEIKTKKGIENILSDDDSAPPVAGEMGYRDLVDGVGIGVGGGLEMGMGSGMGVGWNLAMC